MPEMKISQLADIIAEATKKGRRVDWIERISEIFDLIGGAPSQVNWNGTPQAVAFYVMEYFRRRGISDEKILNAVAQYSTKVE